MPPENRRTRSIRDAVRRAEDQARRELAERRRRLTLGGPVEPPGAGGPRLTASDPVEVVVLATERSAAVPDARLSVTTSVTTMAPGEVRARPGAPPGTRPTGAAPPRPLDDLPAARRAALRGLLRSAPHAVGLAGLVWDEQPAEDGAIVVRLGAVPLHGPRPADRAAFLTHLAPGAVEDLRAAGGEPDTVRLVAVVGRRLVTAATRTPGEDPAGAALHVVSSEALAAVVVGDAHVQLGPLRTELTAVPRGLGVELVARARLTASARTALAGSPAPSAAATAVLTLPGGPR